MNKNLKPVYLLAGGRRSRRKGPDPLLEAVFKGFAIKDPAVAYTGTASGDDKDFFKWIAGSFTEAGADKVTHAIIAPSGADLKKARKILEAADLTGIVAAQDRDFDSVRELAERLGLAQRP